MKKIFLVVLIAAALLAGVTFSVKNSQPVELVYYFDLHWRGPLSWLVLLVFSIGLVTGILSAKLAAVRHKLFPGKAATTRSKEQKN